MIQHINKLKEENSIGAEKAFDKIQYPFMIKTLQKMDIEGTYLNIVKVLMKNPHQTFSMVKNENLSL